MPSALFNDEPMDCPVCGGEMAERTSSKNNWKFFGCAAYPACDGKRKTTGEVLVWGSKSSDKPKTDTKKRQQQNAATENKSQWWRDEKTAADTSTSPPFDAAPKATGSTETRGTDAADQTPKNRRKVGGKAPLPLPGADAATHRESPPAIDPDRLQRLEMQVTELTAEVSRFRGTVLAYMDTLAQLPDKLAARLKVAIANVAETIVDDDVGELPAYGEPPPDDEIAF